MQFASCLPELPVIKQAIHLQVIKMHNREIDSIAPHPEHNYLAEGASWTTGLVSKWVDDCIHDCTGSIGTESSFSRIERSAKLVHEGLSEGLTSSFRDLPKTAGEAATSFAESAAIAAPLSLLPPLIGISGVGIAGLAGLGLAVVLPELPRLKKIGDTVGDYWNHPEHEQRDRAEICKDAPVMIDMAARFNGMLAGETLGCRLLTSTSKAWPQLFDLQYAANRTLASKLSPTRW